MNMLKAAILAEQITGSLPKEGMTPDEIRKFQVNTKIELVTGVFSNKNIQKYPFTQEQIIQLLTQTTKNEN
ncbi:hypothetical protein QNF03_003818 [Vibrio cidicii]|nr:hypothetical protein [Vibrio cidicii]